MPDGLSIGKVSEMTGISKRRLRYYDEHSLCSPAYRDPDTGYRYYTPEQVSRLKWIAYLRFLETPVSVIADFMRTGDLVELKRNVDHQVLKRQQELSLARYRCDQTSEFRALLGVSLSHIRSRNRPQTVSIMNTEMFPTLEYTCDVDSQHMTDEYRLHMFNKLDAEAQKHSLVRVGGPAIIYQNHHLLTPSPAPAKTIFQIQIQRRPTFPIDNISFTGGQSMATAVHIGPYETMESTYQMIIEWARQHNFSLGSEATEEYLITNQMTNDPDLFVTQIFLYLNDYHP